MATIRLTPSTYSLSNTSLTINNVNNMYTNTDSTTYGTCSTTSSNTRYLYLRGFNFNSIPEGATINSFSIKFKANESGLSTNSNYRPYLVNNTTTLTGTFSAINTSVSTQTCTGVTANWATISDYGADFGIRFTVRSASNNSTGTLNVYGAEILVDYTLTTYTVNATSNVSGITVTPATQTINEGDSAIVTFNVNDISDYIVTDNNVDVTANLVRQTPDTGGTVSRTADSLTTGFSGGTSMNFYTAASTTGHTFNYAVGHTAESPGSTDTSTWTYVKDNNSSTNYTGYADFIFDFSSIPVNAIIDSVQVKCYGAIESTSQSTSHADITLYSGNTQKSTMQKFTSTNNTIITISDPGSWTRAELQSAKLRFAVGYYGGRIFGITWNVTYTIPTADYYYTYTLTNVTADHVVILDLAGVFIPPEEDPEYTYYPITISAINATTNPSIGTTRVVEGSNQTITITPSDPQLTLALDNGVDITSQLQGGIPTNTYTVTTQVTGASYGFNLNSSTGYYVSTNNGVAKSASVARLNMDFESDCLVTIQYINYAEANYDYGMFGKLDTTVATDGLTANSSTQTSVPSDSTSNYQLAKCSNSSSTQTITYEVSAGQHYIDIKYGKDDATDSNNDTLQWKVLSIEATSAGGEYTYTLTNVSQKHSLIFIFGDVTYYFVTSSGTNCRLFPDGQFVILPGDNYKLQIVPDNLTDIVAIIDNNTDTSTNLVREDGYDKNNNPVVSYSYSLNNININHTLVITCSGANDTLSIKLNGSWTNIDALYQKVNGSWVQRNISYIDTLTFDMLKKMN